MRSRTVGLVFALAIGGCAAWSSDSGALIYHNRSDTPIGITPGVVVEPCTSLFLDRAAIEDASRRAEEWLVEGDEPWPPPGVVSFDIILSRAMGETYPVSIVISSDPVRIVAGRIAEDDLPPCGGVPEVTEVADPRG